MAAHDGQVRDHGTEPAETVITIDQAGPSSIEMIPAATGAAGILAALHGLRFWVKNPFDRPIQVSIDFSLPLPLTERRWAMAVSSQGGAHFRLDPQAKRRVRLAMTPGRQVWPAALDDPDARDIVVTVRADGAMATAMTYRLDPEHVASARDGSRLGGSAVAAAALAR